jgi:hypothetical protein
MRRLTQFLLIGCGALLVGCSDQTGSAPTSPGNVVVPAEEHGARVVVMTQNLYIGADVDKIIIALATPDPNDDVPTLLAQIGVLQNTDFPTRAAAIAAEVAKARPHVIGLQEVSKIDIDLTPLGVPAVYHVDFLETIMRALRARGLQYVVAAKVQNIVASPFPGISLVDHDVLLVDSRRVTTSGKIERNFVYNAGVVAPGVNLIRGYVSVKATIEGRQYRIANTHPESDLGGNSFTLLRAAQATELVASMGDAPRAIMLGDFNDFENSPMWQVVMQGGFADVWRALKPTAAGFSCCQDGDLANPDPGLNQRIDYVFARGFAQGERPVVGEITMIGYRPSDKVQGPAYPIWPSDHAGLVAVLTVPAVQ